VSKAFFETIEMFCTKFCSFLFLLIQIQAVKRPVNQGGTTAADAAEITVGQGVKYECTPDEAALYNPDQTADVRVAIDCYATPYNETDPNTDDDIVAILEEGSDWCSFSITPPTVGNDPSHQMNVSYTYANCSQFCAYASLSCIDSWNDDSNRCDEEEPMSMTCLATHEGSNGHSCVCWDKDRQYATYWNLQKRNFTPMLIFCIAFPFIFFMLSAVAKWKAEQLADALANPKEKKKYFNMPKGNGNSSNGTQKSSSKPLRHHARDSRPSQPEWGSKRQMAR